MLTYDITRGRGGDANGVSLRLFGHEVLWASLLELDRPTAACRAYFAYCGIRPDLIDTLCVARDECLERGLIQEAK